MGSVPPLLSFLLIVVSGWVHRHQLTVIEFLQAENRLLKQKLGGKRLRFTDAERALLARKAKAVGRKALLQLDTIVSPDTLLRWHRRLVAQKWNFVHRRGKHVLFDLNNGRTLITHLRMSWTEHQRLIRLIGAGGQGQVYLSQRRGADGFTLPVALKIFSPERFEHSQAYDEAMERIARVAARVAQIQQDNLLDVHNFVDRHRIRMMVMELIDGYDLARLLVPDMLTRVKDRVSQRR
jgi:hypothetical protein